MKGNFFHIAFDQDGVEVGHERQSTGQNRCPGGYGVFFLLCKNRQVVNPYSGVEGEILYFEFDYVPACAQNLCSRINVGILDIP
ncbi:hypothetical protein BDZ97DRAFT_1808670 [Flammula alnicola]|nr:hypothetical protein BDZ97DRAFT_1808670 [Flammula alnicola]